MKIQVHQNVLHITKMTFHRINSNIHCRALLSYLHAGTNSYLCTTQTYVSCAPCVISPSENTTPWFRTEEAEEEDKVMSLLSII